MTRPRSNSVPYVTPPGTLTALRADDLVDIQGVNVPYGVPSYSGPDDYPGLGRSHQNNSVDQWLGFAQDIGLRRIRIATGLNNPYGDADSKTPPLSMVQRDLMKLVGMGFKWGMPIWTTRDYTWLLNGQVPKPNWIEGANEPYGFGQYNNVGSSSIISSGTLVTHASLVGQSVPVGTMISDGIRWYCRTAHTASAGTVPADLGNWASQNEYWIPVHSRATQIVEGYIDEILATRGWTDVERYAPSVYATGSPPTGPFLLDTALPDVNNRASNLHEYALQGYPYDIPEPSGFGTYFASTFPYYNRYARTSRTHLTEWGAYRSGPADGLSHVPETEAAYLHVRAMFAGHAAGVASMHYYQLCDEVITWDHFGTSISQGKCGYVTLDARGARRPKANYRMVKNLFSIYGQRTTSAPWRNGSLRPTWSAPPARFRQYLHMLDDGRLLLAFVNATDVFASPGGGTYDTATGSNSNNTVAGTPGQYQNGSITVSMPSGVANTVTFDRSFSKVRLLSSLDPITWTDLGARTAGASVSATVQGFIQILELTP